MSKEFDNLVGRATCQMKVMLRERTKFNVLVKELEDFAREDIVSKNKKRALRRIGLTRLTQEKN